MTFRELLEKYRNGSAGPEEREQVEKELEKFDALSEYMIRQDFPQEEQPEAPAGELEKIRWNIKRRNAVLVCIAAAVACGVFAAACYFEPAISKRLWYDPTEVYNPDTEDFSAQKLDSHIAVLSELIIPEIRADTILIKEQGWGKYELTLSRSDYLSGENSYTYGTVDRGKIELRQDFWQICVSNIFTHGQDGYQKRASRSGIVKDVATAREILEDLPEYVQLEAYASLKRDWNMEEFAAFREKMEESPKGAWIGWTAVRIAPEHTQMYPMIGFHSDGTGRVWNETDELYPYYEISMHMDEPMAKVFSEHFKSLLHYIADHKEFYTKNLHLWIQMIRAEEILEFVEKNGVNTYGFVCYGTPQEILRILEEADVEGIYVSDSCVKVPML